MKKIVRKFLTKSPSKSALIACSLFMVLAASSAMNADETDARRILKAMSDYLAAQQAISFNYDSALEVVTPEQQVIGLASSGMMTMNRPDKLISTRSGGFADVVISFDGKTMTLLGKNLNAYAQIEAPDSIDQLINTLRDQYQQPLPAADLLTINAYEALMEHVVNVKDLGSGIIGGVECDSLAFRTDEVDFQIWVAHGDAPYPCRYVITSNQVAGGPQYSVQLSNWKAGDEVSATDFSFKNATNATKVDLKDLSEAGDVPAHFTAVEGDSQ